MDQQNKDQELANYTDDLLEKRPWGGEPPPLAETVEKVAKAIDHQAVPDHLRRQVIRQIRSEWPKSTISWRTRMNRLFRRPTQKLAWVAMATVLVLVTLAVNNWSPESGSILGTATGSTDTVVLFVVVLALVAGLGLLWYFIQKRKQ